MLPVEDLEEFGGILLLYILVDELQIAKLFIVGLQKLELHRHLVVGV